MYMRWMQADEPGHDACYMDAEDVGDCGGATDYGHIAFVEIVEWVRFWLTFKAGEDDFGGVAALLDGGLGHAGDGSAVFGFNVSEIAGYENIREIGNREVGTNLYFSRLVGWGGSAFGQASPERGDDDASGPENCFGLEAGGGVAMFEIEALGIDVRDEGILSDFDAETGDELFGFGRKIVGISSEDARAALEKDNARFLRANTTKIMAKGFFGNFGDSPGELAVPVAPAPTMTKESQARASSSVSARSARSKA